MRSLQSARVWGGCAVVGALGRRSFGRSRWGVYEMRRVDGLRRVDGWRRDGRLRQIDNANGGRHGRWERHQTAHGAHAPVVVAAPEILPGGLHQSPFAALHRVGDVAPGSPSRLGRHEEGRELRAIVRRAGLRSGRAGDDKPGLE